jgi:flavodoxin
VNSPFRCVGLLWVASCFASRQEEMMNALVVYDSQYGNTERIAQVIADTLGEFGEARAVGLDPGQGTELEGMSMFIVGCPTQGWKPTPTIQSFLEELSSEELRSLAVACFDTRFRLPRLMTGSAARVIARTLQEKGVSLLVEPESFFVKGTQGPLRDGELDRAAAWARMLIKEVQFPSPEARQ